MIDIVWQYQIALDRDIYGILMNCFENFNIYRLFPNNVIAQNVLYFLQIQITNADFQIVLFAFAIFKMTYDLILLINVESSRVIKVNNSVDRLIKAAVYGKCKQNLMILHSQYQLPKTISMCCVFLSAL